MQRKMRVVVTAASSAAVLAMCAGDARANSGTQLPLSQYQAGTEQTSAALVTNGTFEQPGSPNPNPDPTGWTRVGSMQAGTPMNPPSPPSTVGNFAAQGPLGSSTDPNKFTQMVTLAPSTDYVISAYMWNFGQASTASQFGDLTVAELVDPADPFNTKTLALERVASDMGDGAGGYFIYDTFNSAQFTGQIQLEVEADFAEMVPGPRPSIWAQIDNVAITLASQFVPPQQITVGTSTWNTNGGGLWSTAANWQGGVPDASGAVAVFGPIIQAPATVTLDSNRTVGAVVFDNPNKYTIAGTSTLTLDSPSGTVTLSVPNIGSHEIATPIQLQKNLVANVLLAGSTLRLSNQVTGTGFGLIKNGNGALEMTNVRLMELRVNSGTVRILPDGTAAGASRTQGLVVEAAGRLDITNNAYVVDYDGTSPLNDIKSDIATAYNGGAWDAPGITSSMANNSTHGIGFAEASSLSSIPAIFAGADSTSVLFRYTRYGDANLDGQVNLADFNRLAANFGSTNANWDQGDFTYDNLVNLSDFNRLAANFGLSASGPEVTPQDWANLAAAVPEPSGFAAVALGAALLGRRARRAR